MNSAEIREAFLDFFHRRSHEIVKSSSLIPHNDPTLLFTNAGMVQFKSLFLGQEKRPYTRATTCQKCMRAGGKHSDLENVGHTARHHTFFEMLGNFSFGDYFKQDAIVFAWELLVEVFKLPAERLWVSVFEDDDEAERLWTQLTGVPSSRIVRLGAKDNFWQMGDTGPCGPCSEIIIDQGASVGCKDKDCKVGCDCDRFLELWNLVFMQFDRDATGKLTPLPKPSIDTGMGLERITAVLQGRLNNFDTDLFRPTIEALEGLSGKAYKKDSETDISFKVIADHLRAAVFLISDGLTPSNDGRGYVLRRIIRRASRHARLLGLQGAVLYGLVDAVIEALGKAYPEIVSERDRTVKLLRFEEERFTKTLEQGMRLLDDLIIRLKAEGQRAIPGEEIFKLYDTYGFPIDLVRDIAMDQQMTLDEEGFTHAMQGQRERARASWVGEDEAVPALYKRLASEIGETLFTGYDRLEDTGTIKTMVKAGVLIQEAKEGEEIEVFLDRTPFYGESGGQVGDKGRLFVIDTQGNPTGAWAEVADTLKKVGLIVHKVVIKSGLFRLSDRVLCLPDKDSRHCTARNHTATHLLHKALRLTLGEHVKQGGSLVSPERLRFDFSHFYALEEREIEAIEDLINEKVMENLPVLTEVKDLETALKEGVTALFDEKYGDTVRVVTVPNFSSELCGGTHCKATGDIGLFTIVSEGSVASGIRRIEALTGKKAFEHLRTKRRELKRLAELLKTDRPTERIERLLSELKDKEKVIEQFHARSVIDLAKDAINNALVFDGVKIVAHRTDGIEQKDLRTMADAIKDHIGSGIILLASTKDGQTGLLCMVTKDLSSRINAGKILGEVARAAGGKGGGKAEMAQGGAKDTAKIEEIFKDPLPFIRSVLG
jgi:alanyl-tRNA synthetase